MTIKAIVLDIDGTLLTDDKIISPKTKEALIKAQEKGVKVILASGRPTKAMYGLSEALEMKKHHGYLVSHNGATVVDCQDNALLYQKALSVDEAKSILEHLKQFKVMPMVEDKDHMMVNNVFDGMITNKDAKINIIEYESRGGGFLLREESDLAAAIYEPVNKILVAAEPSYYESLELAHFKPFEGKVNGVFSAPFYFEFTALGVDKASALQTVLSKYDIYPENVISFGDSYNDMSIITYAKYGIAMGNAVDAIKEAAHDVTLSNNEDGIAVALEKYSVI